MRKTSRAAHNERSCLWDRLRWGRFCLEDFRLYVKKKYENLVFTRTENFNLKLRLVTTVKGSISLIDNLLFDVEVEEIAQFGKIL